MNKVRRYDIDWLRVLVFALLIFYHVGMFFVPWGWHIKNPETYDWLRWPMIFLNQWRLPILFVISGMGTRFALSWRSGGQYSKERLLRLGIPLVVGMLLIVPPQIYIERLVNGQFSGSYWEYYTTIAFSGIYPEGNISWHHLWFLPYLLIYSLLLTPIFLYLRNYPESRFLNWCKAYIQKPFGLYVFIVPLYFCEALLEPFFPVTHALIDDWFTFMSNLFFFLSGYILISLGDTFWEEIARIRSRALGLGLLAFFGQVLIWFTLEDNTIVHFSEALLKVINIWSWILVLIGYGAKYLNQPSPHLHYMNEAVYPFYIFHQTITIIIGYFMLGLDWDFLPKFLLMTIGTFLGSWLLFELVRRVNLLRPLFGLKGRFT